MATVKPFPAAANSSYKDYERPVAIYQKSKVVDFAECKTLKGSALAQNDVIEVIPAKAGEVCVGLYSKILVADAGASTCDIGVTGDDADGFTNALALNGTAGTVTYSTGAYMLNTTGPVLIGGKSFATADTIDLVIDSATAPTTGRIEIVALFINYNE